MGKKTDYQTLIELRRGLESANDENLGPHNIPLVVLGTLILWVGWLLFNGGSSLGVSTASGRIAAVTAVQNTFLAPGASGLTAMFLKKYITGLNKST